MKVAINQTLNKYFPKPVGQKININPKTKKELKNLNAFIRYIVKNRLTK